MSNKLGALVQNLPVRILVTGGAGFIGSHVVDTLAAAGKQPVVLDDHSNSNTEWVKSRRGDPRITFVDGSVLDAEAVNSAMAGCRLVMHLAANAHIDRGLADTELDLAVSVTGTRQVLEAMHRLNVSDLMFASSGAVYGTLGSGTCREDGGPLLPLSLYGAGKAAAEAVISAYASLFGIRALIFRFGNVLGARMSRGAIRDFLLRVADHPSRLVVLGDGRQCKSYFLVEDCIEGMFWVRENVPLPSAQPAAVFNLGNRDGTTVREIAGIVLEEAGVPDLPLAFTGGSTAFPGDQPVVNLDVSEVARLGWSPATCSPQAVRTSVRRIMDGLGMTRGAVR